MFLSCFYLTLIFKLAQCINFNQISVNAEQTRRLKKTQYRKASRCIGISAYDSYSVVDYQG